MTPREREARERLQRLVAARDVAGEFERDRIVARVKQLRDSVALDIQTIQHWNRTHPDPDSQISHDFEDAVLLYLDGKGPMPEAPHAE